jgi:DNA-binding MarR family transcriptional regulator
MTGSNKSIFDPIYRQGNVSAQISRTLFTIGKAIKHLQWDESKSKHLTPTQVQSLLFLKYIRPDAATVNTLAKHLTCTPATISGILDTLENKKFIVRSRKSNDKRRVLVSLTPKGIRAISVFENFGKEIEKLISEFNQEEQEILGKLLMKLARKLIEKGYGFSMDVCRSCCFFISNKYPGSEKPHYCRCLNILLSEKEIYMECPDYKEALS